MKYEIVKDSAKKDSDSNKSDNDKRDKSLDILVEEPKWSLPEIALSEDTIEQIEEMIVYVQKRDKLLHEWQFSRFLKAGSGLSVNFFGSPGTGKSITAEAIAKKLGMSIIRANYGEIESSLVGGTSENLARIFKLAEDTKSLLFFDEADAVLSRRISNLSQAADHGVNSAKSTLLTLLDKFNGIIVFATNLFDNYDEAFLRRIIFNVEFLPPDYDMRIQLWKFHLAESVPRVVSYESLASISDDLSGGDIKNITIKLGLKLLTEKINSIDEPTVEELIEKYKNVKARQKLYKSIDIGQTTDTIKEENHLNGI
ncbi:MULTISPECIES: ATP-binding protein [Pseudanabaena]|uniref:AAA ATPase central domain protein n=2 Tax=Pseudanabaena TaxID=1152 RepID=L8N112_9CYAN|nr:MULTISPECIES: ATP-binding protein [Pseudanabaena]ELS33887.1 AAA ATPase central domain protein [Pseudanabaena biceps PCC 7429]MDG3493913.1 ATP-binding protein [Pseudanabaena catenata USMAC16]